MPRQSTSSRKYRSWSGWRSIGRPASVASVLRPTNWGIWFLLARTGAPGAAAGRPCPPSHRRRGPRTPRTTPRCRRESCLPKVATPVTRPPRCSIPVTLVDSRNTAPRAWARRTSATRRRAATLRARRSAHTVRQGFSTRRRANSHALPGLEHGALDAPRCGPSLPAMQFGEALRRRRHFQTADLVETPLAVEIHACELFDRLSGEVRHRLRGVGLKDQTRSVRRRASGQRQRALIQHGHSIPAASGELIGQVRADDTGARR